jgi:hypothetical protein
MSFTGTDPYVNNWNLAFQSYATADIGVWTVTLSASLMLYPSVSAATSTMLVTVTDPCLTTVI